MTALHAERALLPAPGAGRDRATVPTDDVELVVAGGRIVSVRPGTPRGPGHVPLDGLTLPGLANTHSHAFHRALRGRAQADRGTFWTWREAMYAVAARLDPASYRRLATALFRELAAAGVTSVGEFHYVHHRPGGGPYDDAAGGPNAMALAVVAAARDAGLRITLLDTCYLAAGFGQPLTPAQARFGDGDADGWWERTSALRSELDGEPGVVVGTAVHSVRAVPPGALARLAALGVGSDGRPLHVHLSEQVAENEACLAATGRTPTALLEAHGLLGPATTLVHATHLTDDDVARIGAARAFVSLCPTTERDLGDGIGPGRALAEAGARLTVGSDSHAVVDLLEELRAVEMHERLARRERGHLTADALLVAGTSEGHAALGHDDVGRLEVGARADLVTLDTASPRTAGTGADAATAVFAATAADVRHVVVDGRVVHTAADLPGVGVALAEAVAAVVGERVVA